MSGERHHLGPPAHTKRFRVVEDQDVAPIPHTDANVQFKTAWGAARLAYVATQASLGGPHIERFLFPNSVSKHLSAADVRHIRNRLAEVTKHANEMLAALDQAVDITKRAVPDEP